MRALCVLVFALAGCGEPTAPRWCRVTYHFTVPDSLATDAIPWWDPDAPVVAPDSVIIETDCP